MSNPFERLDRLQHSLPRGSEPEGELANDVTETFETTEAGIEGVPVFASPATQGADGASLEPEPQPEPEPEWSGQLTQMLADEQRRLLQRREQMMAERQSIEAEIGALDGRIGHVDALLTADQPGRPPVQLRGIGSPASGAA